MRTLAIDLGTKRVGLAMSDAGGKFATPMGVLSVSSPELAIDPIAQVVAKEGVERIVLGLPLNMDDTIGPAAKSVIGWAIEAKKKIELPFVFVDERLSSFDAEQQIQTRKRAGEKITRKSKKEQLDALAATTFLQAFLDGQLKPIDLSNWHDN